MIADTDGADEREAPSPLRILVAEDVEVNRELIRLFLEPRGYAVDTACDGFEAVEAVRHRDYDMVIMDMQMPGMDGLEATRIIRGMGGAYASLPIVALSANIIPDQVQWCLDAGMSAHVPKPFTSEELAAAVEKWAGAAAGAQNAVLAAFVHQAGWASVRGLLDKFTSQTAAFEHCPAEDVEQLGRQAHALRGAAGALGYAELADACRAVEEACRSAGAPLSSLAPARQAAKNTRRDIALELARAA